MGGESMFWIGLNSFEVRGIHSRGRSKAHSMGLGWEEGKGVNCGVLTLDCSPPSPANCRSHAHMWSHTFPYSPTLPHLFPSSSLPLPPLSPSFLTYLHFFLPKCSFFAFFGSFVCLPPLFGPSLPSFQDLFIGPLLRSREQGHSLHSSKGLGKAFSSLSIVPKDFRFCRSLPFKFTSKICTSIRNVSLSKRLVSVVTVWYNM